MLPTASVTKSDGNTGVAVPSEKGICAIIGPCQQGVANQPTSMAKAALILATFGYGVLPEYGAHMIAATRKPVVLVKAAATTAATYGAFTLTGTGTSVPSAGATAPLDDFQVQVRVINGGTRGTDGITYQYSLDGGDTWSATTALGTATSIVIPNSGVQIALGSGTLVAGDIIAGTTTGPRMQSGDLTAALEALRTSGLKWECVLIGGLDATASTVTALDSWLAAREAEGKYRMFVVNARMKNAGESESTYLAALTTIFGSATSIRGCVGADGGDVLSAVPGRGLTQKRPTALALAARLMAITYGRDAAYVADGPVSGFALADALGNPNNHDEALYPGLDDQRLVTLRSFDSEEGTFITNPRVISPTGSDYQYAQHVRTMNRACELVYGVLTRQLSRGVRKNPKRGPNGEIYIAEDDARILEGLANDALNELRGDVVDLAFTLSRTDDIGQNGPITLNGEVALESLAYAKGFNTNAKFTRSLSVTG